MSLSDIKKSLSGKYDGIFTFSESVDKSKYVVIPTGSSSLDEAIGIGGLPLGRIVVLKGIESSGKSALAIHCLREAQNMGLPCLYIDAEHALDPKWMQTIGVDLDEVLIKQAEIAEDAFKLIIDAVEAGIKFIVLDSIADLIPRVEAEGEIGDQQYALLARVSSQALRKIDKILSKEGALLLAINQVREKMGVMYGSNETTPGGRAWKHAASVIIDVRRKEWLKRGDEHIGLISKAKVEKNKVSPPFKTGEYRLYFDRGIDDRSSIIEIAIDLAIVKKGGAWYSFEDVKSQGIDAFIEAIGNDGLEKIKAYIKEGGIPEQEQLEEENPFSG